MLRGPGGEEDIEELEVDKDDVKKEIQRAIKNGKVAGTGKICPEMIKYGGEKMLVHLSRLCNKVWRLEKVLREWRESIIVPLPKK